jgi:hypothetical protein
MNVASIVERKTRFAVLFRNNDRSSTHFMRKLMDVMEPLPQPARKSITFDRGFEFREWRKLKSGIGTDSWFCDPQAPWQKGSVENLNKRARRYLPRDTQLAALSNRNMKAKKVSWLAHTDGSIQDQHYRRCPAESVPGFSTASKVDHFSGQFGAHPHKYASSQRSATRCRQAD